ncbi:hypothetical protein N7457_003850, partial [Penicillium paradoxum]|uniref:uncharacterized protein n=1 Tax=Penicillium paradoxum TaxID=176176 RepID=UPI002547A33C
FSLKGRTALVTGGARGCGLAFARGLAEAGADVAVFDVVSPEEGFHAIEKDCGVRTAYYKVDVSSQESLQDGFASFQKDFDNALDICVTCAGINRHMPFLEFTYKEHHDLLSINVLGVYFTAQLAAKQMIANKTQHGSIVLVASMASHIAVRSQLCSAYCGTKGAVRSMCPAIAKEMADYGIRVNSISPGYVRTEMTASFPHLLDGWKSEAMNGRIAEPEDIMGACVFLASDASEEWGLPPHNRGAEDRSVLQFNKYKIENQCFYVAQQSNFKMSPSAEHEYRVPHVHHTSVVVVGAGPSGLMLACNLVRFGIDVMILDDRPDKTSTGKADGMQPKTIETFKQLGLAEPLLNNGARVYDIAFWESTATEALRRTGRKTHYPKHVGATDPYILLAHQGMVEQVMIDDLEARGVFVMRNSRFVSAGRGTDGSTKLDVVYVDNATNGFRNIRADYVVGCDGARSKVRRFIPDADLEGEITNAAWGVLDGVIDTDFPDLWSKVALRTHSAGSILWIPRERGMTRLYVELSSTDGERVEKSKATTEYVMARARAAMHPFKLEWKTVEWFGTYVVGQRVAKRFMNSEAQIFIAGDAGHCHSALAAQGANTSMHDSFNLAWKLNLFARGLAKPSLLQTYEEERQKIAYDLINFDAEHCKAFAAGDEELVKNFDDNIRFISGIGAEYSPGMLTRTTSNKSHLRPGMLQLPAQLTRYIDANPVDFQLDIPLLGQFKIYIFVPDVCQSQSSLQYICGQLDAVLASINTRANQSYGKQPRRQSPSDQFVQSHRYTTVSNAFTFAMVTQSTQRQFEIADLPELLQQSRWTLYVDNVNSPGCTEIWFGELEQQTIGITVVRPDGYVGAIDCWDTKDVGEVGGWLQDYFSFMM